MLFYSPFIAAALAFGLCAPIASAAPLRLRSRCNQSPSNDAADVNCDNQNEGNRYRVRQNVKTFTYFEGPARMKKKRDVLLGFFPGDDNFSMASAAPSVLSDEPSLVPSDVPSTVESLEPTMADTSSSPSSEPTDEISAEPTTVPSSSPSSEPTEKISMEPTTAPSENPSEKPILFYLPSSFPSPIPTISDFPDDLVDDFIDSNFTDDFIDSNFNDDFIESNFTDDFIESNFTDDLIESNFTDDFIDFNFTDDFIEFNFTDDIMEFNFTDDFDDDSSKPTSNFINNSVEDILKPTQSPSQSPTLRDCLISQEERTAQIFELLDAVGNSTKIRDLNTPQGLAAEWLINQDFRKECPGEKIVQRWAIAVFYFSTDGESWSKCSAAGSDPCGSEFPFDGVRRFLSDFSECEWAGITCNVDDCVTEIEFEENGLVGTIPTELGLLKELAVLGMERGGLSSTIPSEIGILTNLVFLDIDFNVLTGSIPTALYLLTNLQTLDLNDNLLEGDIDSIGVLGDLEFLQLQSNQFSGTVPEGIGNLTLMTTFNLHENLFSGIIPDSVCDLRDTNGGLLKSLIADCGNNTSDGPDIECICCSSCRD